MRVTEIGRVKREGRVRGRAVQCRIGGKVDVVMITGLLQKVEQLLTGKKYEEVR